MRNRFWWWLVGGATLLYGAKVLADNSKKKPGELFFRISFSVPQPHAIGNESQFKNAVAMLTGALKNFASSRPCSGLPPIKELLSTRASDPTVGSRGGSIDATYMAEWTHDKMGDVRPEVLACVTKYLKGLEPQVSIDSVSVSRIS